MKSPGPPNQTFSSGKKGENMTTETLSVEDKMALVKLARSAISARLEKSRYIEDVPVSEALNKSCGAFVTLHLQGRLRGCIGRFTSDIPLAETVKEMARAAAFEDPRFPPVKSEEFKKVDVEISVLTPMHIISDPEEIEVGKHGIYIVNGLNRGVLLPQVATEQGWNREQFLDHTCLKAGLDPGCWKNPESQIFIFSAEVFGEKELEL